MIHLNTERTLEIVQKRFGKTFEEACKQFGFATDGYFKDANYPWGVSLTQDTNQYSTRVQIGFKNYINLIAFTISYYPSCCGTMMFHTFLVDENRVTQEAVDEIMSAFFKENEEALRGSNRIEVMMVERRPEMSNHPDGVLAEVEPVKDPKMKYKMLWNFFHKTARRVRTRLEVNRNTWNIIHNMEVVF